jgi:group II intron reverse transcriptase/maturase/CRISPR-associated endonuclease Cas1
MKAWKLIKEKNAASGIDGASVADFDRNLAKNIAKLTAQLQTKTWSPDPYLRIEIPKNEKERRKLGLLSVKDKIIQQAIRLLIEPRFERLFVGNSYAYRPEKGVTKAIRRTLTECGREQYQWVVRLDIDDFFDNVDHHLLATMLIDEISDEEVVRLVMLSIKMGVVNKRLKWNDSDKGVPQGAILSPLLANLYLTPFDKFVLQRDVGYVRYADDFILLCKTREEAEALLAEATTFLTSELHLSLNPPAVAPIDDGFEYLGVLIRRADVTLSERKWKDVGDKIARFDFSPEGINVDSRKAWASFSYYYGAVLPQADLARIDKLLIERLTDLMVAKFAVFRNKTVVKKMLNRVDFLSNEYKLTAEQQRQELVDLYLSLKRGNKQRVIESANKEVIRQKKNEYRKLEGEGSELYINKPGVFVGLTQKGVTVKEKGALLYQKPLGALTHIILAGKGITLSSNLLEHCLKNKISVDFFDGTTHIGSFVSSRLTENTLWVKQAQAETEKQHRLASLIIEGKVKNQFNLIKYFHKYHKTKFPLLEAKYDELEAVFDKFDAFLELEEYDSDDYIVQLVGFESQIAILYWAYLRQLLADDEVDFEKRIRKGAADLVNSMLNYGYAILYTRAWQALLAARLNPYESIIHVRQAGKPTFVYDFVELFRSQVVDRVVITLIQRGVELNADKGVLDEETRKVLAKGVLERLNRYEKHRGSEMKLEQVIKAQAKMIAGYYENDLPFKPYVAKW